MADGTSSETPNTTPDAKSARILARSLLKDLRVQGFTDDAVLALTSELLGLVATDLRDRRDGRRGA